MPLLPATFEPFYQYDNETATWTGFLPELIHALAAEVDIDYEIVPQATAMGALLIDPTTRTFIGIDPNGQLATGDTDMDWMYIADDLPFMNVSALLSDPNYTMTDVLHSTFNTGLVYKAVSYTHLTLPTKA